MATSSHTTPNPSKLKHTSKSLVSTMFSIPVTSVPFNSVRYFVSSRIPVSVIDDSAREFHFILAFARDLDSSGTPTCGNFIPYWDTTNITPEGIDFLKTNHPTVKVMVSIGGRGFQYPFKKISPSNQDTWLDNAYKSLSRMIDEYHLDGIDVLYDTILTEPTEFSHCIGTLIRRLKEDRGIGVASISPSAATLPYYYPLNAETIDWINYQFYLEPVPSPGSMVELHKFLVTKYGGNGTDTRANLLPGYDPQWKSNLKKKVFTECCTQLKKMEILPGMFFWWDESYYCLEQILASDELKEALATAAKVYKWTPEETSLVEENLHDRDWTSEEITKLQNAIREKKFTSEYFANRPDPVHKSTVPPGNLAPFQCLWSVHGDIHFDCSIM